MTLVLATARTQIADFLSTLIYVYTLLIIVYIVLQLLFTVGLRPPYSRTMDAILGFLRDICEPFLRIFRRVIPAFGGLDFSPILAIFTLQIVNRILVEGAAAAALAAALLLKDQLAGRRVALILTGGNISIAQLKVVLNGD